MTLLNRLAGSPGAGSGRRTGQIAVLAALSLMVVFGTLGLATDLGWDYFLKQRVQTSADAAASAAAVFAAANADSCVSITCPATLSCTGVTKPATTSLQAGCIYATKDGPPVLTATMTENNGAHPPTGLNGVTPSMWVQASVSASTSNHFLFLWGFKTANITSQAIAGVTSSVPPYCLYVLDKTAASAFSASNGASLTMNCALIVDSNSSSALSVVGGANVTAGAISVVGGTSINNGGSTSPSPPTTGAAYVKDPFAAVPALTPGSCSTYPTNYGTYAAQSFTPGTYCNGIIVGNGATVTFAAGTYIISAGGMSLQGGTTVTGSGVMFYLAGTASTYGSVNIANGANVTFSAQTSGAYEGLLFFQDRSVVGTSYNGATFAGGATLQLTGSLYFPTTSVNFSNGTSVSSTTAIVADTVVFTGGADLKYDSTGAKTGLLTKTASLLQ